MSFARRAILLAAGRGRRLGSLTDERPKCMIEIGGISILERSLRTLSACGVSEVILVVGYRSEQIRLLAGDSFAEMSIRYVNNERHSETNTAYSLWLARHFLTCDLLLVEGDILFDPQALSRIGKASIGESVWAAMPVAPGRDEGILLARGERGYVERVELVREPDRRGPTLLFKCAGIQLLTDSAARAFGSRLHAVVGAGERQVFADLVLGGIIHEHPVRVCPLVGTRWAEVDDLEDLSLACRVFDSRPSSVAGAG